MAEALEGFVYEWRTDDGTVDRSEGFARILGYSSVEAPPTVDWWRGLVHPDDLPRADAIFERAVRSRDESARTEYRVRRRDGRWLWLRDCMRLRYGPAGLECVVGCALDIDDERTASLELRAEHTRRQQRDRQLSLALEVGRMGTWSVDPVSGRTLLGGGQAELVGLPAGTTAAHVDEFFHAVHADDRDQVAADVEKAWVEGTTFDSEFRVRRGDEIRWISARGEIFDTFEGPRMAGVNHDITQQKRVEEELLFQTEMLESQERRKDFFLAALGHELRNPLAALDAGMRLLRRGDGDVGALHTMMSAHIDQLSLLVDDLLEVSRIAHGKVRLRPVTVDLAAIVERGLEAIQTSIRAKGQQLATRLDRVLLEGDPTRLEQVATNLLSNATKFTPSGGTIEVEARREADDAVLVVADSGPGIDPTLLETLFEPFSQSESASEGLGIGLSLAHGLVTLHGGSLDVDTSPTGTTFTVRLPRGTPDTIETPPARGLSGAFPVVDRTSLDGLRVLVVDDVQASADALALLLRGDGCEAESVYTAADAVERCEALRPHAVLLDIGLPDLPGYDLAPQLRGADGGRPFIVAMTGFSDPETRRRVEEAGIDLQLLKPVDYDAVIERLRRLRSS